MKPKISIIIPVYNEANYLSQSITALIQALNQLELPKYEIILVENGSRDASWAEIQRLQHEYYQIKKHRLPSASYGQALKAGILLAKYEYVVIYNVDLWDISFLNKALTILPAADIIVGSKTLIASNDKRTFIRRNTTYFFNSLLRLIFNFQGTDTHGIKILQRRMAARLVAKCRARHELVDTELILRACREEYRYFELPINVCETRPTRYNNFKRIYNTTKDMYIVFRTKFYDISHHGR